MARTNFTNSFVSLGSGSEKIARGVFATAKMGTIEKKG
jgi:hypothetical protein